MVSFFPVTYSIPSGQALLQLVKQSYSIEGTAACRFWQLGSHATYSTKKKKEAMTTSFFYF
ncbi:hypothetical protein [Ectobacillus ponti]|uniref:Uncharacterized protein n=1 Tax=Ectobacillus ponti TaxID=2961894 RepID=A0AA42BQI6_9BACI|nr:hypothetical protein [Ectobacillus ponti]MCP8969927.1 hypothetical protein [Ectobacillus ponti]